MAYLLADVVAAHTSLLLLSPLGHVDRNGCAALHAWAKCVSLPLEASVDAAGNTADKALDNTFRLA
ncbi:hypothetical protein CYD26_18100 [Pseudomonas sp. FFUP_PS_473]|nr:hypothetical protein CYD26_18100 [Pseudomonas sp. FFUP_PS_473]